MDLITTLVPNSGIQFIDFTVGDERVAHTRRRFFEDRGDDTGDAGAAPEPSLHVASIADGVFYHPVTNIPCDPQQTYTINGIEALEPFLESWLPLPFMRISGRDGTEELGLDDGPANWVRAYIAKVADVAGRQKAGSYRVVLAIDTTIEGSFAQNGGHQNRSYAAPSIDDLKSGAAFRFSDDVGDVAWFATEAWVDEWLSEAFGAGRRRRAQQPEDVIASGALEHLAHYLTLLAVLKEACELPALRFMEPNSVGAYAETVPVDLALDIGTSRTCALIHERQVKKERPKNERGGRDASRDAASDAHFISSVAGTTALPLRDLSRPWLVSEGLFSSRLEFARASFGNDALSRWSGRTHAFHWPSLVRVGPEAERLSREPSANDTVTGVSSPLHYVWDESVTPQVWRFAGSVQAATRRNPIVAGALLAHVSEAGDVLDGRDQRSSTTKPRFSRSSLSTFFVAELLLHTVSVINSSAHRMKSPRSGTARRLDRILVAIPAGMPEPEQNILRRRIESAVRLVWKTMGWHVAQGGAGALPLSPAEPTVVLVADTATSSQVAFLRNEISHKYRGKADQYLALMGRQRAGYAGARALRIATLDFGASQTGLAVATYELSGTSTLSSSRQFVDGFGIGGDDVVKALAERFVVPALEQRLIDCKLGNARRFVEALVGGGDRYRPAWVGDLGRRFTAELVMPAARGLARLIEHSAPGGGDSTIELTVRALLASVGADAKTAADRLDVLAADEGADGFAPLDTVVPFLHRDLVQTAQQVLGPVVASALKVIEALDCDLVLLTGGGARLPQIMDMMLAGMPLRPDRIVSLHDYRLGPWCAFRDETGRPQDAKHLAALGAMLQGGSAFGRRAPGLVVQPFDRTRSRTFVGRLDRQGLLATDDVLFTIGDDAGERTRTLSVELPVQFGMRRTSLAGWPAQPLYTIELIGPQGSRQPRMPLKVTLEQVPPDRGQPVMLRLVSAFDADGNRLDASEIALQLKTKRFADGHWLDTGRLEFRREEPSRGNAGWSDYGRWEAGGSEHGRPNPGGHEPGRHETGRFDTGARN